MLRSSGGKLRLATAPLLIFQREVLPGPSLAPLSDPKGMLPQSLGKRGIVQKRFRMQQQGQLRSLNLGVGRLVLACDEFSLSYLFNGENGMIER